MATHFLIKGQLIAIGIPQWSDTSGHCYGWSGGSGDEMNGDSETWQVVLVMGAVVVVLIVLSVNAQ